MLFISYWELNQDLNPTDIAKVGEELLKKGLYPIEGVKQIGWYITPGYWGVTIEEADSVEQIMKGVNIWRAAKPGIFKFFKMTPCKEDIT